MMKHQSIHDLFSETAERFKSRTAVERGSKRISYEELENRSNRLATLLISAGLSRGSIVAIVADDSIEIIASIIGILRAGCVFVPLDPLLPDARLKAIVSEAPPACYMIESGFLQRVADAASSEGSTAKVICLDETISLDNCSGNLITIHVPASCTPCAAPSVESSPDDMSYIYFTSGSSGRPKGIAGRLKGIDHFIKWEMETFGFGEGVRVSQLTSPSFDPFLRDAFLPLAAGGTVCVPDSRDTVRDSRELVEWIDSQRINLVHCVPSLFRSLLNEDLRANRFQSLTHLLLAGEPVLPSDVRRWTDIFGERVTLVNLYGPTETTMTKFCYVIGSSDKDRRTIPIGRPIEGASALVVGEKGNPCSAGMVGEIYIRTPYRTHGYYNRPDLTDDLFVQNPFSDDPNDIIYKTGDLGRVLSDGNFEFLGRKDRQLKIRGIRIEPAEIEDLLLEHAAVKDAAVVDQQSSSGGSYLCAYVVLNGEVDTAALRTYLVNKLPDYMTPSTFVVMQALPRTISGKIDRRSLPTPGESQQMKYEAPRTPVEEALVRIWANVLSITRIGIRDNFFTIGGHSLLATQLLSRVRAAFDVEVPLRVLFDAPTVADQALIITQAQVEQANDTEIAQLVEEIKHLSGDAIQRMLAEESQAAEERTVTNEHIAG